MDYDRVFNDLRSAAAKHGIDLGEVEISPPSDHELQRRMAQHEILTRQQRTNAVAAANAGMIQRGVPFASAPGDERHDPEQMRDFVTKRIGDWAYTQSRGQLGQITGNPKYREDVEILQRVVQTGVSADGTAPVEIIGDLVQFIDPVRYAINATRLLPMPADHSPTFKRPRLVQSSLAGQQMAEGDVLASQRVQLEGDTITKNTWGSVLSMTEQEVDFTSPEMLGVVLANLAESYAIATDAAHCAAIQAAAIDGNETVCALDAASDVFIRAISDASATVYTNSKKQPDTLFVAVDRWSYLTALTDGDGRPLFPITGSVNVAGVNAGGVSTFQGMNVMGLRVVVDPNFDENFWAVGVSQLAECFEQNKGLVSINIPSTISVQYAVRGYFSSNVYEQGLSLLDVS